MPHCEEVLGVVITGSVGPNQPTPLKSVQPLYLLLWEPQVFALVVDT